MRCDRAEYYVGCRHREVAGVMLADPEVIRTDMVGKYPLLDDVPDRLGMPEGPVVLVMRDVAEGVESEDQ